MGNSETSGPKDENGRIGVFALEVRKSTHPAIRDRGGFPEIRQKYQWVP